MTAPETIAANVGPVVSRYTRFVRSTKLGLGFVALILIGLVLFYPVFRKDEAGVRISFNTTSKKEPEPTAMKNPHFHGLDKDNQPYNMAASSAAETTTDQIRFTDPSGDILLRNNKQLFVKALTGVFDKKLRVLRLMNHVRMSDEQGYVLTTESIMVDIAHKSAATAEPVYGEGELGTLKAYGGAMADGNNQQIIFEGPVFVTLNMEHKPKSPQEKNNEKK